MTIGLLPDHRCALCMQPTFHRIDHTRSPPTFPLCPSNTLAILPAPYLSLDGRMDHCPSEPIASSSSALSLPINYLAAIPARSFFPSPRSLKATSDVQKSSATCPELLEAHGSAAQVSNPNKRDHQTANAVRRQNIDSATLQASSMTYRTLYDACGRRSVNV